MIAILTCFKNEAHILQEWIEHYRQRGIEHIYMINDFSTDNYIEKIQPYLDINFITVFNSDIVTKERGKQLLLYNKYFYNIVKSLKHKWFFVLDMDEFLYSPNEINLNKVLEKYDNYSELKIWMHNFGSSNLINQPNKVVENFILRSKFDESKSYISYKSGFKASDFIKFDIHSHGVKGKSLFISQYNISDLVINHYSIQSLDMFKNRKLIIGDVNNYYSGDQMSMSYFKNRDSNEILDETLKQQTNLINQSRLTCVSAYWKINNKHGNKFEDWFKNTLKINCPYVFFGDKESIALVKKYRGELPTYYIEYNIEEFVTYKYKDNMITDFNHCPSIELNLVWNEKIFMIQRALKINPFSSDFFCWIDAGICIYRNSSPPSIPFPNINKLNELPQDKFIYSSTNKTYNDNKFQKGNYAFAHHVSGTYILHKNIINRFVELYKEYLNLIDKNDIWTDQVILTHIYKDNKELFYKYCDGYGSVVRKLF